MTVVGCRLWVVEETSLPPTTNHPPTVHMRFVALLFLTAVSAPQAPAQVRDTGEGRIRHHPEFLVQTSWLASNLGSPKVVVLHVGHTDDRYRAGHIPGALFLP